MVTFECIKIDGDIHTYKYYPNGDRSHPGEFVIDKKTNELIDIRLSDEDEIKWFLLHALSKVRDGEENGGAIWY